LAAAFVVQTICAPVVVVEKTCTPEMLKVVGGGVLLVVPLTSPVHPDSPTVTRRAQKTGKQTKNSHTADFLFSASADTRLIRSVGTVFPRVAAWVPEKSEDP
jgi:hypothetical protein